MATELPNQRYAREAVAAVKNGDFEEAVEKWKLAQVANNVCAKHTPRRVCCAQCLENWLLHLALASENPDEYAKLARDLNHWVLVTTGNGRP